MKISGDKSLATFEAALVGDTREKLSGIPGWKRWKSRTLVFKPTGAAVEYILANFPDVKWEGEAELIINDYNRSLGLAEATANAKEEVIEDDGKYAYKTKPRDHQRQAFLLSRDSDVFGLLMEMGTGKTKVGIDTAAYLFEQEEIDRHFILAPPGVHDQWIDEQMPSHHPDRIDYHGISWRPSQPKYFLNALGEMMEYDGFKAFSMNIEAIRTDKGFRFAKDFCRGGNTLITIDESIIIKNSNAEQSKAARKLGDLCPYRRIMCGAPITRGMEDMFGQLNFLGSQILGLQTMTAFKLKYCYLEPIPGAPKYATKILGYRNIKDFERRIKGYTFRVSKDECLDLPPKIYKTVRVPMSSKQAKAYEQMRDEMLLELEDVRITTAVKIANIAKLSQIACGVVRDNDGKEHLISNVRHKRAVQLAGQAHGQAIIWARFKPDFVELSRELSRAGISFVEYHGGIKKRTREDNKRLFQDGAVDVFLANPQAGGRGLNLQNSATCIYFCNSFDADHRWQSEDRIHRDGQSADRVLYIDLVAPDTVDDKILHSLKVKKDIADAVHGGGYKEFLI